MSTNQKSSNLTYEQVRNHYLDTGIVPVEDYLDRIGWVLGDRSDLLIQEAMSRVQVDAGRRYYSDKNSDSRFILRPKLTNLIHLSVTSLELKPARKVTKQSRKDFRGPWDTLAPGSTVLGDSPTTTVIQNQVSLAFELKKNDIAKFRTNAELNTPLWQFTQGAPFHMKINKGENRSSFKGTQKI